MMTFQKSTKTLFSGLVCALWLLASGAPVSVAEQVPVAVVKIQTGTGEYFFNTEIATTDRQRQNGLMYRKIMAKDAAMLFRWQYPQPISMWMKNTYISLDMIFIDAKGQVVNIARRTTPLSLETVSSNGPASAVLEVVAGTADAIGLKAGDKVNLPAIR